MWQTVYGPVALSSQIVAAVLLPSSRICCCAAVSKRCDNSAHLASSSCTCQGSTLLKRARLALLQTIRMNLISCEQWYCSRRLGNQRRPAKAASATRIVNCWLTLVAASTSALTLRRTARAGIALYHKRSGVSILPDQIICTVDLFAIYAPLWASAASNGLAGRPLKALHVAGLR